MTEGVLLSGRVALCERTGSRGTAGLGHIRGQSAPSALRTLLRGSEASSDTAASVSPSGRTCPLSTDTTRPTLGRACSIPGTADLSFPTWKSGLSFESSSCISWRQESFPHSMQITSCVVPCISITRTDPARWCKRSTFCVKSDQTRPADCSRAMASCAVLGRVAFAKRSQPAKLRALRS